MAALYEFARVAPRKLGPQAKIVAQQLKRIEPATTVQVAEAVQAQASLVTRQPVLRVVAYYLALWKRQGLVTSEPQLANSRKLQASGSIKSFADYVRRELNLLRIAPPGAEVAVVAVLNGSDRAKARKKRTNAALASNFGVGDSLFITFKPHRSRTDAAIRHALGRAPAGWGFTPIKLRGEPLSDTLRRMRDEGY